MSFKQNDTNQIHLGNYEEFFILYMDNELTSEQMKMVDEFLASHPDLRGEFEVLMSIKLPSEEFSINKDELYAGSMKASSFINEDLLLYMDNELSPDKSKVVELELKSNKEYHFQHQLLLKTKLDASETITYPNKEELYRRTEKVVAFKLWMRVAAAIILVAVLSFFYYKQSSNEVGKEIVKNDKKIENKKTNDVPENKTGIENLPVIPTEEQNLVANNSSEIKTKNVDQRNKKNQLVVPQDRNVDDNNLIAQANTDSDPDKFLDPNKYSLTELETLKGSPRPASNEKVFADIDESINKSDVTNGFANRTTIGTTPEDEPVAKKGSVKGFLRKATRLIEKRTGFDPTNENGELLLGVVAVKLK